MIICSKNQFVGLELDHIGSEACGNSQEAMGDVSLSGFLKDLLHSLVVITRAEQSLESAKMWVLEHLLAHDAVLVFCLFNGPLKSAKHDRTEALQCQQSS